MISFKLRWSGLAAAHALILALGCASVDPAAGDAPVKTTDTPAHATSGVPSRSAASSPSPTPPSDTAASESAAQAARLAHFRDVVENFSEPDAEFFSRNYVSNETSFLQVANELDDQTKGGVYLGVGPEQNFTYIALTQPKIAYIVDIRRQNLLLHLLYKAVFEEADNRTSFVALLIGRDPSGARESDTASIDDVLAATRALQRDGQAFEEIHRRLVERIQRDFGVELSPLDQKQLTEAHQAFFERGLELRFELDFNNGRRYPSLGEILAAADPTGTPHGFLSTPGRYQVIRDLERSHLVIPVVGNFAGEQAMPKLANALIERKQTVRHFYVSNVEQYLFEPGIWPKWVRNVAALPTDQHSMFIRAYLDQGRPHPAQLKGHRTASLLQPMTPFVESQPESPSRSFWQLVNE